MCVRHSSRSALNVLTALAVLLFVTAAPLLRGQTQPNVATLYSSLKFKRAGRALFDFRTGRYGTKAGWDLDYGSMYINSDLDWFKASTFGKNRHVLRDLGPHDWSDDFEVPVLTPRPDSLGTKEHPIRVNASAGEYEKWVRQAAQEGIMVKAVVGHMYALHAKNSESDYYVLFRVESIERGNHCTISWRLLGNGLVRR